MAIARTEVFPTPPAASRGLGRRTMLASAGAMGVASVASVGPAAASAVGAIPPAAVVGATAAAAAGAGAVTALASQIVKVTVEVNKAALVGQLYAFLSDPARANASVVQALAKNPQLGLPMPILESLLMEGDLSQAEVEQFVDGMLGGREGVIFH